AKTRIKLMRLLWDFLGSEFGSRHQQYEKFYGGGTYTVRGNLNRLYDYKRATALVDAALALSPTGGETRPRGCLRGPLGLGCWAGLSSPGPAQRALAVAISFRAGQPVGEKRAPPKSGSGS